VPSGDTATASPEPAPAISGPAGAPAASNFRVNGEEEKIEEPSGAISKSNWQQSAAWSISIGPILAMEASKRCATGM
jgi:hypothetical protein